MSQPLVDNKLIAKNTMFLYFRMLLSLLVSLYTTRVVLEVLGVVDYGLYNVIGGILSILSVLKVLVSSGTQRFLSFEIGKGADLQKMLSIFTSSLTVFLIIGLVIFVLAETIGLWFINSYLIIPEERTFAANVVYQVTIVSMFVSLVQIPYNSAILSHERMDVYGYIGIAEPLLKLLLIMLLPFMPGDKLITYSLLLLFVFIGVTCFYVYFCRNNFAECQLKFSKDWGTSKSLVSFTVWNLLETISNMLSDQGQNILLNIYFGPIVNAARAVAYQVNGAVHGFASNFLIATFPQITKQYAAGNFEGYYNLMIRSAKFSFIVISIVCVPIILNTEYVLVLWLKATPGNTALFIRLVIIAMMIRMVSEPLYTGIQATGIIKRYQIVMNSIALLNLPICFVILHYYRDPVIVFYVTIIISVLFVLIRAFFIKKQANFPAGLFLKILFERCLLPFCMAFLPFYFLNRFVDMTFIIFCLISIASVIWTAIVFFYFSMFLEERQFIVSLIRNKIFERKRRL